MIKYLKLFSRMIKKNWALKLIALFFAILVWSLAWSEQNPMRSKTLADIPVNIIGEQTLSGRNLMLADSLEGIVDGVDVGVEVRQKDYSQVTADKVTASIDVSTITSAGTHVVKLNAETTQSATVKTISPDSIEVFVDEIVSKTVTVSYVLDGEMPDGYWQGTPELSPNVITIRGAKTDVEKIASARCTISLDGLTDSIWQAVNVTLLNSQQQAVENSRLLDALPSVIVKMEVAPYKDVAVDTDAGIVGEDALAAGYEITGITVEPETVRLIGDAASLAEIEKAAIEPVDVSGQNASVQQEANLVLPEGVSSVSGNSVLVRVEIGKQQESRTISNKKVEIIGTPAAGQVLSEDLRAQVVVSGAKSDILHFYDDNLVLYVNVDGMEQGSHSITVLYRLVGSIVPDKVEIDPLKVTVKIG